MSDGYGSNSAIPASSHSKKQEKLGHRRVTAEGNVTYKRKTTSEIQQAIQIGINYSVAMVEQKAKRDVLLRDFGVIDTVLFPKEGTKTTPAHSLNDFKFKIYAPIAFRFFRELFKVDMKDFLNSLCNEELVELSNPGSSGSIFYITYDDEFIIKTVQHKEADFLQKLLPEYFMNLTQHPRTLLPKFYGLYSYVCGGKNIRFVIMNNILPTSLKLHEKYDLKGSTYGRVASQKEKEKPSPTLKDLDFKSQHPSGLWLDSELYETLKKTIERDCRVLESFRIMDYSMLLAIHNLDHNKTSLDDTKTSQLDVKTAPVQQSPPASNDISEDGATESKRNKFGNKSVRRIVAYSSILPGKENHEVLDSNEEEEIPHGGIPARNEKGERLVVFIGIIDILQSYRLLKKMEHAFKAAVHEADAISVHNPGFYAHRFQTFVGQDVFKKMSTFISALKQAPNRTRKHKSHSMVIPEGIPVDNNLVPNAKDLRCSLHNSTPDLTDRGTP